MATIFPKQLEMTSNKNPNVNLISSEQAPSEKWLPFGILWMNWLEIFYGCWKKMDLSGNTKKSGENFPKVSIILPSKLPILQVQMRVLPVNFCRIFVMRWKDLFFFYTQKKIRFITTAWQNVSFFLYLILDYFGQVYIYPINNNYETYI